MSSSAIAAAGGSPSLSSGSRLVLASGNPGKLREFSALLATYGIQVIAQRDLGINDAEEPHATFVENALAKARHASRQSGLPALADDSGICVDALNGRPGVRSARFAEGAAAAGLSQDAANNARLLRELAGLEPRTARYVCVLVLLRHWDDPMPLIVQADWRGVVVDQPAGEGGFGYDAHFWLPDQACTAAQLSSERKNQLSHRGRAVRALMTGLRDWLGEGSLT